MTISSETPTVQVQGNVSATSEAPKRLSRRQALKAAGAGVAGVLLASSVLPALAQEAGGPRGVGNNVYLPLAQNAGPDTSALNAEEFSKKYNWKKVEDAFGHTSGKVESSGIFKISLPRTDIQATIADIAVKPDFALDGEIAFQHKRDKDVMKFEVVLLDAEVNPVLDAWFNQNIQPELEVFTALHNHYLFDRPQIRYMHGFGTGNAVELASALYKALKDNSATPFGHGDEPPGDPGFDDKKVEDIIGGDGELTNGILSVSVERKESFEERGVEIESSLELEHMFNFQAIDKGQVATIDEFVLLKDEVDPVARRLRKEGFLVTALHSHELDIEPNVYYIHCWATGDPIALARSIRKVLEMTNSKFK